MAATISSYVLDGGLDVLNTEATTIVICNDEPTTYNEANTTFKLGQKVFGAGNCFSSPQDVVISENLTRRKVSSYAVTDGAVSASGTATHFAVVDASRLLLRGTLASGQDVIDTQTFTLSSFDVMIDINSS